LPVHDILAKDVAASEGASMQHSEKAPFTILDE